VVLVWFWWMGLELSLSIYWRVFRRLQKPRRDGAVVSVKWLHSLAGIVIASVTYSLTYLKIIWGTVDLIPRLRNPHTSVRLSSAAGTDAEQWFCRLCASDTDSVCHVVFDNQSAGLTGHAKKSRTGRRQHAGIRLDLSDINGSHCSDMTVAQRISHFSVISVLRVPHLHVLLVQIKSNKNF